MGYIPSLYTATQAVVSMLAVGVASTAMLLYRYQRSLVYPSNFPAGSRTEVMTPDAFDVPDYESLTLTTPDGEKLHAYLMAQRTRSAKESVRGESQSADEVTARRPTVLFLHANAGNMGHRLPLAAVFYKRFGCNVFMLSYRGYGLSTGQPSEVGIRIDAQTALDYIRNHAALKKTTVVAYGQSIGGAVAVDLASRNTRSIHGLVLENTFLSIPELIPHVLPPIRPLAFLCREFWPTSESIRKLPASMPILFMSGRGDDLVPPSHMDALFERCPSKQKVWKEFATGTHNDTCIKPGYFESIGLFLATYIIPLSSGGQEAAAAALSALSGRYTITQDAERGAAKIVSSRSSTSDDGRQLRTAGDSGGGQGSKERRPSMESSEGEWVQMSARDIDGGGPTTSTDGPALSAAPQDSVKPKSNL